MKRFFIILTVTVMFLTGCEQFKVTTLKTPDFTFRNYKTTLIRVYYDDIQIVKDFESEIQKVLFDYGITSVPNHKILPPLKEYTKEEIQAAFDKYNVEALLTIKINTSPKANTETREFRYTPDKFSKERYVYEEDYNLYSVLEVIDLKDGELKYSANFNAVDFKIYTDDVDMVYVYGFAAKFHDAIHDDKVYLPND